MYLLDPCLNGRPELILIKLIHYKALPDGDEYCELGVVPTTEKDREEFAAKDSDLKSIDR